MLAPLDERRFESHASPPPKHCKRKEKPPCSGFLHPRPHTHTHTYRLTPARNYIDEESSRRLYSMGGGGTALPLLRATWQFRPGQPGSSCRNPISPQTDIERQASIRTLGKGGNEYPYNIRTMAKTPSHHLSRPDSLLHSNGRTTAGSLSRLGPIRRAADEHLQASLPRAEHQARVADANGRLASPALQLYPSSCQSRFPWLVSHSTWQPCKP
ncbi:hypothetical protein LZ30DRAFT_358836 [Colletotrichum cereale]|nr:hypothetical protein LZ30DRAFT_358836 [Colletotrichum cereale]